MEFISQHPFEVIGMYWLFSAIVGGMPAPSATSGPGYIWAHNSLHILAGNLTAVVAAKFPQGLPAQLPPDTAVAQRSVTVTDTTLSNK